MTDTLPQASPAPHAGQFNAGGRSVGGGRGWDWIVEAFVLFRRQPGMWILIMLIAGILFIAISVIPVLGSLASTLLFPIFGAGIMLGCKAQDDGGTLELTHLFAGFKQRTGDLVMVGVFNLVCGAIIALAFATVVGGGVFMGMMRGGMPGAGISIVSVLLAALLATALVLPLTMAMWFAPALIVLNEIAPMAALKASLYVCMKNWLPFLVYSVVLLVLVVLAAIPAFLGYLVLFPVLAASVYTAYRDIFHGDQ